MEQTAHTDAPVTTDGERMEMKPRAEPSPAPPPAQTEPSTIEQKPEPSGHRAPDIRVSSIATNEKRTRQEQEDKPNKPPRVLPNTYWTRKGGGWILEYKRKIKHKWLYEYFGLLKLETWNQLKGRYQDEKLKGIIKGVIGAKRTELQRARNSRPGRYRLRLVGKR